MTELFTMEDAAFMLKISGQRVRQLVKSRNIKTKTCPCCGRVRLLDRAGIDAMKIRKPGNPWHRKPPGAGVTADTGDKTRARA